MSYLSEEQRARFQALRAALDNYVADAVGSPAKINAAMAAIRPWKSGAADAPVSYRANVDVRLYEGVPYTCSQTHSHSGESGYAPGPDSAIWKETHGTTPETARPFVTRGDNPYMTGETCIENDVVYRCKMDNITWPPSAYPAAWEN